ncbi:uncharacterized protein LOC108822848 [Raphanus sativus]|uniref:Uncharacterized protein LOC108822848 n=1 Tax=Raphanus sativus TaxID=3726 RepID=A0A6J0KVL1_RAPSA|nr:uncharacterized protein LOC108822848 [Raphanus sativus]
MESSPKHTVTKEKDLRPCVDQEKQKIKRKMEIQARLKEYKLHFMVAIIVSLLVSSLVYLAPRILDILSYFWPLFASTAAFLAVAITCGGFQQLSEESTGEGIMEYVAGRPEDSHKYD